MFYETILTREQCERYRADGLWPDKLLNDYLDEAVARHPEKTASIDVRGRYTYAELRELADRAALAFLDIGVHHGDAVTVQLPNWKEFIVVTLALERIGAVINPVAPIFRERELRAMLRLARPVVAVIPAAFRDHDYLAMFKELGAEMSWLRSLVVLDARSGDGVVSWDDFLVRGAALERHKPALAWLRPGPDDVSELIFTSGTTGEPKGVMHTANSLAAAVQGIQLTQGVRDNDVIHMASTFGHQTGFLVGVRLPLHAGAMAVFQDVWEPATFVGLIEQERISFTMGATPFLADTLRAPNLAAHDISSLRLYLCGGAPIPPSLAEEASRLLPCRLVPLWGMSENGAVTMTMPDGPPEKIVTSDGRPYPGVQVTVCDADLQQLPTGEEGDLYARGVATFAGYVQGRHFTEQFFTADGWFNTGDRAVMDADGYIRISGRTKDIIIRGGENVPVKEIEDVLLRHPAVRNVALVATPDPRLGELGCACIIPEPGQKLTLDAMRTYLAEQQVTRQFWPERVELVDEFPMTPSGKVQKFRLREIVQTRAATPTG
jgi:cyclohexanecarboxylate-CoA ligase